MNDPYMPKEFEEKLPKLLPEAMEQLRQKLFNKVKSGEIKGDEDFSKALYYEGFTALKPVVESLTQEEIIFLATKFLAKDLSLQLYTEWKVFEISHKLRI